MGLRRRVGVLVPATNSTGAYVQTNLTALLKVVDENEAPIQALAATYKVVPSTCYTSGVAGETWR